MLPILAASALLLTGALAQQTPQTKPPAPSTTAPAKPTPPPTPPPPKEDPKAKETLAKAIDELDPRKLGWLETKFWQQVDTNGFSFQADGHYRAGPKDRMRLDLLVHLGGTDGQSIVVSDGATVWSSLRVGKDAPVMSKYDLKKVQDLLNSPGTLPQFSEDFFKGQSFRGVAPLLQNMRQQMTFTKQESERWNQHEVFKLKGEWNPEISKMLAPPPNPWPPSMPRFCYLYLDKNAPHWPYRVEWWGPPAYRAEDKVLMQMEFRDPKFLKADAKPPESLAQAFTFDPGKTEVADRTKEMTEHLTLMRNRQSAPRPATGGTPSPKP
jgi:hypothetical protein